MSDLEILAGKLTFLRDFYALTTKPFQEIKRKIDVREKPYIDHANSEDYDEPPFLSEWLDADAGLKLQQQVCLTLLQRSFKEFLDRTIRQHCDYPASGPRKPKNGESWFDTYKAWFWEGAAIDWDKSPVSLGKMEELSLARNCVQHGGEKHGGIGDVLDSHSLLKRQSKNYHERFPNAFFADELEKRIWEDHPQPVTINLTPEKLNVAIEEILTFCKFIHDQLPVWMQ